MLKRFPDPWNRLTQPRVGGGVPAPNRQFIGTSFHSVTLSNLTESRLSVRLDNVIEWKEVPINCRFGAGTPPPTLGWVRRFQGSGNLFGIFQGLGLESYVFPSNTIQTLENAEKVP